MPRFLALFESAIGLSLFDCKNIDDEALTSEAAQKVFNNFPAFQKVASLVSFAPFPSAEVALDTMNQLTEYQPSDFMRAFLKESLPDNDLPIGISEPKLGSCIQTEFNRSVISNANIREVIRGIRLNFLNYVQNITAEDYRLAEVGLSHGYSRAKVKFNEHGDDNMVISSSALLTTLEVDLNTYSMRLREWYAYHFPELSMNISDHYKFAKAVLLIQHRENEIDPEKLTEITGDRDLTNKILQARNMSMGREITDEDLERIVSLAKRVVDLFEYKGSLAAYLKERMHNISPNVTSLLGERLGAQLITLSGSLDNLAKASASTIQIKGAEKAYFNACKKRKPTPKYGILFNAAPVQAAAPKEKGKVARTLANKVAIAARLDAFSDEFRSGHLGECMREQMDARVRETEGARIKPNLESMLAAVRETRTLEESSLNQSPSKQPSSKQSSTKHSEERSEEHSKKDVEEHTEECTEEQTHRRRKHRHHRTEEEQEEKQQEEKKEQENEQGQERRRKHRHHRAE